MGNFVMNRCLVSCNNHAFFATKTALEEYAIVISGQPHLQKVRNQDYPRGYNAAP
jgi:hypothetical protein